MGTIPTLASPTLDDGQKKVTNCVAIGGKTMCPNNPVDQDLRAGFFKVSGLAWDEYSITETQASIGYHLSFTTPTKTPDGSAPVAGTDNDTPTLNLGQIANSRVKGSTTWTKTDD